MYEYTVHKDLILNNGVSKEEHNERNSKESLESHTNKRSKSLDQYQINHFSLSSEYGFVRNDLKNMETKKREEYNDNLQTFPIEATTLTRHGDGTSASSASSSNNDEMDMCNIPPGDYYEDIKMNDRDLSQIQTKEFNKMVKKSSCDKERRAWLKQRRRTLKNRGYASSCRENREKEQDDLQLKIAEQTNKLMEKRVKLADDRNKQMDLIDAYKKTFRRVEGYYNLHCKKEKYYFSDDIDIEEDLFDSNDSDSESEEDTATVKTIIV